MGLKPKPTRNWIIQIQLGFGQYKATKDLDNIKPNRNRIRIQSQIFRHSALPVESCDQFAGGCVGCGYCG